jgi:hypothetical protein
VSGETQLLALTHFPLEQSWPEPHFVPQAPQLLGSLAGSSTQLLLQAMPMTQMQVEPRQKLPLPQELPQAPQSCEVVLVSTQAPLQSLGSLGGQLRVQRVPVQTSVDAQAFPQLPQFAVSLGTQVPPQGRYPLKQVQALLMHRPPPPQLLEQLPQNPGSEVRFTQIPPQRVYPVGQGAVHTPLRQESPAAHFVPHPPQLFRSVCLSTQLPEQRERPPGQTH